MKKHNLIDWINQNSIQFKHLKFDLFLITSIYSELLYLNIFKQNNINKILLKLMDNPYYPKFSLKNIKTDLIFRIYLLKYVIKSIASK